LASSILLRSSCGVEDGLPIVEGGGKTSIGGGNAGGIFSGAGFDFSRLAVVASFPGRLVDGSDFRNEGGISGGLGCRHIGTGSVEVGGQGLETGGSGEGRTSVVGDGRATIDQRDFYVWRERWSFRTAKTQRWGRMLNGAKPAVVSRMRVSDDKQNEQGTVANSGLRPAADAGAIWDNEAVSVTELVRNRKNTIGSLPEEGVKSWRKAVEPIYDTWSKQISDRGQNGQKLLESARELVAKYESA
jgi:hypothetical protein